MTTPLEAATLYARRGFAVIPIPYKSKRAVLDGWQHLRLMEGDLAGHFAGNVNIGILTGEPSGWLVDVDCDSQEAVMVAPDFLPRTAMAHGHGTGGKARSKPRSHYWYRSHVAQTKKYQFPELDAAGARSPKPSMLVELRSSGCQTIVPPSVHPNGETLFWDRIWARDDSLNVADKIAPAEVTPADLERAVAKTAASALLARHWPGPGSRDIAALALCGMLARAGWSDGEIDHFATVTAQAAGDEQWRQRGKARHTREHLEAGKRVTGAPQLAGVLRDGQHVVDAVRLWLNLR
jgi:putative DNA primase/helicase